MAQSLHHASFVCRSCRSSLSKISYCQQTRTFANTSSQRKTIPTFTETSSEDLNAILLEFRNKVFKPAALSKTHEKLIYKKSRHHILRNDPGVSVTLSNDEEIKLEPMDRWDRPNKQKSLYKIARILGRDSNIAVWENLPKFLGGLMLAKERIPIDFLEKVTRKANEVGRAGLIRKCAETADQTGMRLSIPAVTRELFLGIHSRAAEAQFKGESLDKVINEAEFLTSLMEKEDHCGGRLRSGEVDMRRDPVVIAVLLELHAAKALEGHGGNDVDGKVTGSAHRLLALSSQQGGELLRRDQKVTACHAVEDWIPIANSIRLAMRVAGLEAGEKSAETKLKMSLRSLLDDVDKAIADEVKVAREDANGKPRRAFKMLEVLQQ